MVQVRMTYWNNCMHCFSFLLICKLGKSLVLLMKPPGKCVRLMIPEYKNQMLV
jgi:hypothetical protein